jgi:hypothetical protein
MSPRRFSRDVGEADGDDCFRIEKANKFVGLGAPFAQQATWAIFSRAIGERLSVYIQIESGWYIGLGDGKHSCIGSTFRAMVAVDALGRCGATSAA